MTGVATLRQPPALATVASDTAVAAPAQRRRLGGLFWLCALWLALVTLAAITAAWLPLADPVETDFLHRRLAPGPEFLLGTDDLGRDILSRVVFGARVSLTVALGASLIAASLGLLLGLPAGYFRGRLEALVMSSMDIMLAFPAIILVLLVATYAGATVTNVVLVLGILGVPVYTRIARATTLAFSQRDFVEAARALGATHLRIMLRELLPNVLFPVAVVVVLGMSRVIVIEGILSFLGLSIPAPAPTWGNMIQSGVGQLAFHPHISFVPAAAMFLTILALNLAGDALRKLTDLRESSL